MSGSLGAYLEALDRIHCQAYSGYWQNSVPWNCRSEVLVPLLAVSRGHSPLLEAPGSIPLRKRSSLSLQTSKGVCSPPHGVSLSSFSLCHQPGKCSLLLRARVITLTTPPFPLPSSLPTVPHVPYNMTQPGMI